MTATRRRSTAPKVIAKPTPVDIADAAVGRKLREFFSWLALLVTWVASGWLTLAVYLAFPENGVWGALAVTAASGVVFVLLLLRWSR